MPPGRCSDRIVDSVGNKPRVERLTQHLAGRLPVPGSFAAVEIKGFVNSGSGITAISKELVETSRDGRNRVYAGDCWTRAFSAVVRPGV